MPDISFQCALACELVANVVMVALAVIGMFGTSTPSTCVSVSAVEPIVTAVLAWTGLLSSALHGFREVTMDCVYVATHLHFPLLAFLAGDHVVSQGPVERAGGHEEAL